ncbi:MAG: metalloregulator ArsR/SmtB family transcription factor, partial [Acidimicrobiia bacterium]
AERVSIFRALSDPHRLQLLELLSEVRCNCDLQELLQLAPNLLSYHLRVLREAGLVVAVRRGRWVDYSVTPDAGVRVAAALPQALKL